MKLTKTAIIAIIAAGGLLASSPALRAQDTNKGAPPAEGQKAPKKGGKGRGPTIEQLTDTLKLTDEQKPKVQAALDERNKKMQELAPEDRATKGPELRDKFNKKMKEILTEEQYKQFEAMPQGGRGGKKSMPPPPDAAPKQ